MSQPIVAYVVLIIVYLLFSSMDPSIRRRRLIVRGAAMVAVMSAWFFIRFRRMTSRGEGLPVAPCLSETKRGQQTLGSFMTVMTLLVWSFLG